MDKKGQMTWIEIGGFILAIVVVIIVIMFSLGFFRTIKEPIEGLPGPLVTLSEACKTYAINLAAFCEFKKVDIDKEADTYLNCEYGENNEQPYGEEFQAVLEDVANKPDCSDDAEKNYCKVLRQTAGFKTAEINILKCLQYDLNFDKLVNEKDVEIVNTCVTSGNDENNICDVNNDGEINSQDVQLVTNEAS